MIASSRVFARIAFGLLFTTLASAQVALHPRGEEGIEISFDSVPLVRSNSVQVFADNWKTSYYSSYSGRSKLTRQDDKIVITHHNEKFDFLGTETFDPKSPTRLEISLDCNFPNHREAKLEWAIGYLRAFALDKAKEAQNTDTIHLTGPIGDITFHVEQGPHALTLIDGIAKHRPWSREEPIYWIGFTGIDMPTEPIRVSITFTPRQHEVAPDLAISPKVEKDTSVVPETRDLQIIPTPKKIERRSGELKLSSQTSIFIADDSARTAAQSLLAEAQLRFGWTWAISSDSSAPIRFEPDTHLKPEEYLIDSTVSLITIRASTPRGFFYGAQTLEQLLQPNTDGVTIPAVAIDDYPTFPFRGVHFFPGNSSLDLQNKLIQRIIAHFKFNSLVLQCENAQWQSDPAIWTKISIPKDDLQKLITTARQNCIEPIPLVPSLGHLGWMFQNNQHIDLAEDPQAKWAYDVTNPKSYEYMRKLYDETIALFHSDYFHIGHDEVTIRGRYPFRDSSKPLGTTNLFNRDVAEWDQYFRPKKMKMMLWGDMLLGRSEIYDGAATAENPEEAAKRRAAIPKGTLICDWHYEPLSPEKFNSLKIFHDAGLQTIASTWYDPLNIYNFARAAKMYDSQGLLQTTWAGFSFDLDSLRHNYKQFTAYVLAAEYAWNPDSAPPDKLPWHADEIFGQELFRTREPLAFVNRYKLDFAPITLAGNLLTEKLPRTAMINVNQKVNQLTFTHATNFPARSAEKVGKYIILFVDNTREEIPLNYAINIRALDDEGPAPESVHAGKYQQITWTNPHPEKTITQILFTANNAYVSPTLQSISASSTSLR